MLADFAAVQQEAVEAYERVLNALGEQGKPL